MLYLNILFIFAGALASVPRMQKPLYSLDDLEQHFEEFIVTHGKQYAHEAEKLVRFEIFKQNIVKINQKNSDPDETATFGINKFSDLTAEEFLQRHTGFKTDPKRPNIVYENVTINTDQVSDQFDWRTQNKVTPVKDQGNCGSCWAFSSIGCVESAYAIKHETIEDFAEQQLVDCDKTAIGCRGGWMQKAIQYIVDAGGIEGENNYPYKADDGKCAFNPSSVQAKVLKMLPYDLHNDQDTKQNLRQKGPISIAIDATVLQGYSGGIIKNCPLNGLNHGVLLVGYGEENGNKYWIVKNSWSTGWGEEGFFRIGYDSGSDNPCGMYNGHAAGAEVA